MSQLTVKSRTPLRGRVCVPGDKSISHRALLLGALASGDSRVQGFLFAGDCLATLACLRALGIEVEADATRLTIHGRGLYGLNTPAGPLNCARSGTTMRLLMGLLAGQSFTSRLTGEDQLLRRPMQRVVHPLRRMGAEIQDTDGYAPVTVRGQELHGVDHTLVIPSAQVKSAVLLAGLYADGATTVRQPVSSRDHTERVISAMGASIETDKLSVTLSPSPLSPISLTIPGDISSAAFPLVAATLLPASEVTIEGVGLNPTRTGLLDVLLAMGGRITVDEDGEQGNEPVGVVTARSSELQGVEVGGDTVVRMIDEFPVLAVAMTQAHGTALVRDAAELRVKETDRIATLVTELRALGAKIESLPDGFAIEGPTRLRGAVVDSHGDHRLAMALAVAGLVAQGEVTIRNASCISDSFPSFVPLMRTLGADYD